MLTNKQLETKIREVNKYLITQYKKLAKEKEEKRDYSKYEHEFMRRVKTVIRNLEPLLKEATQIRICQGNGPKPKLTIRQKLRLFLIKQLVDKSNRNMAYMLDLFCILTGIDISYKTVERLYSDIELEMALHNFHILLLKKKKVKKTDCCGDATGYSLIISKHYASHVQKLKDKAKKQDGRKKKRHFVYKFALMDLKTRMYVCYGTSLVSEKKEFDEAIKMLKLIDISINSIRLDKYYSFPCYVKMFPDSKVYIIPRKNAKLGHGEKWLHTMQEFVYETMGYLGHYYKRNNSENGFGVDKKLFGWKIRQKRDDRIDTAGFSKVIWHNLFYLF
jgi:transposase